jgi:hypothetical protein
MDACPGFVRLAQQIPQEKWKVLRRAAKYKVKDKKDLLSATTLAHFKH